MNVCVCLCALYRKRDGIIAKNQIENNSKKSNIDIDLNKDVNEYYYYGVWNGVAAAPTIQCARRVRSAVCVYFYVYCRMFDIFQCIYYAHQK